MQIINTAPTTQADASPQRTDSAISPLWNSIGESPSRTPSPDQPFSENDQELERLAANGSRLAGIIQQLRRASSPEFSGF